MGDMLALPRRFALVALVSFALFAGGLLGGPARAAEKTPASACTQRLLVLGAMPSEIGPLLAQAQLDRSQTKVDGDRTFYVGRLRGKDVIIAMTRIGILNAEEVSRKAFDLFRCGDRSAITGVVFSGVAGGHFIGDVAVPQRWTEDGEHFLPADSRMLATARKVARGSTLGLERTTPVGDAVCACIDPSTIKTVELAYQPRVIVGGDGISSDPFGGRKLPCFPSGGDVFGCEPCMEQTHDPSHVQAFVPGILPFVDPAFFSDYFAAPVESDPTWESQDMESAAVARVAAEHHTPFIAFRAVSDGAGDPLGLPGFPFQFFFYRQLAADNAATATMAFLQAFKL
jgi:nucleoside phosphorylase